MASIRARARCDACRRLLTLTAGRTLLLPEHDCPNAGTKKYGRVYWQATVKWAGKPTATHSARTSAAASAWARGKEEAYALGEDAPRAPAPLLKDWQTLWWSGRTNEPTTMANDAQKIRTHILPKWGETPIDEIQAIYVQQWVAGIERAPDTVRKIHSLLSQMLDAAAREQLIPANPCQYTTLPAIPPGRDMYMTREEVDRLADVTVTYPYDSVAVVLAYTGMRWGELLGLRVGAVDFETNRLQVVRTWTSLGEKEYPKSRRRRTLPMPARARDALEAHLAGEREMHGELDENRKVFVGRRGLPLNSKFYARTVFPRAVKDAGLDEDLVPHDLRHTCASWLVQAGVPIYDVMAWLGHADIRSAMRYAHLAPDHGIRSRDALDLVPPVVPPPVPPDALNEPNRGGSNGMERLVMATSPL